MSAPEGRGSGLRRNMDGLAQTVFGSGAARRKKPLSEMSAACAASGYTSVRQYYDYNNRLQMVRFRLGSKRNQSSIARWVYNYYLSVGNPTSCAIPSQGSNDDGNLAGTYYNEAANSSLSHTAAYTPTKPAPTTQHQCEQAAYSKAEDALINVASNVGGLLKSVAMGTVSGAVAGCVLAAEIGCIEGGVPGTLSGVGGVVEWCLTALYREWNVVAQLSANLAACREIKQP